MTSTKIERDLRDALERMDRIEARIERLEADLALDDQTPSDAGGDNDA